MLATPSVICDPARYTLKDYAEEIVEYSYLIHSLFNY
jgi:hypothetical protein